MAGRTKSPDRYDLLQLTYERQRDVDDYKRQQQMQPQAIANCIDPYSHPVGPLRSSAVSYDVRPLISIEKVANGLIIDIKGKGRFVAKNMYEVAELVEQELTPK